MIFNGRAKCAPCHVPPLFSEPGWPMHTAEQIGIDDFQSSRSPDRKYRTTPLRGLFARAKGGFYHDGRFSTLPDVVQHYETVFKLGLNDEQKADLVTALDDRYYELERLHGEGGARLAYESHAAAIEQIEKTVAEEKIECGFERLDGFLFVPKGDSPEQLDWELEAARRAGCNVE